MQQWLKSTSPLLILALLILLGLGLVVIGRKAQLDKTYALIKLGNIVKEKKAVKQKQRPDTPSKMEGSDRASSVNTPQSTLGEIVAPLFRAQQQDGRQKEESIVDNEPEPPQTSTESEYPTAQPGVPGLASGYQNQ